MSNPSQSHELRFDGDNYVTFCLNGKVHKVSGVVGGTSLLQYLRDQALLRGTKYMCREGGCGACIVNLTFTHPSTGMEQSVAVNSCLFPLYSCQGMTVTTVEGIGSKRKGYHPVQTRLAHFYGTQCGYCSPGWVMAMYSLLKSEKNMSMKQIEDSFASNNCRCTGYRPILEAFKSFAVDSTDALQNRVADIEDLLSKCSKTGGQCSGKCKQHTPDTKCITNEDDDDFESHFVEVALSAQKLCVVTEGPGRWYRVTTVPEIFQIFTMITGSYMLVGGNTAQGVFEMKYPPPPDTYIDINGVAELKCHTLDSAGRLVLGANKSLTETLTLFQAVAIERPVTLGYLEALANHITKVAHIPVRNVGTVAGNLSTKHNYPRFPSDLFTIFETVGAQLVIESCNGSLDTVSLPEYLDINMYKKVIKKIIFKPVDATYNVKTYKVARRAQNDHAAVNAGFCFSVDKSRNFKVLGRPRIVYGGIKPTFIHAVQTEAFLEGKSLLEPGTLQKALARLDQELRPDRVLPEASQGYRKGLALSLFYRYVLSLDPSAVHPRLQSGAEDIARPLSSGRQEYVDDPSKFPLTEPMPKLESLIQCSGEIEYTNDALPTQKELYVALVLTKCGPATLAGLDSSAALRIPGVVAFFSAKDIPGVNTFISILLPTTEETQQLFADREILHAGQAVGVVVADSQELADFAAQRVVIKYADVRRPLLYVPEVLESGDKTRLTYRGSIKPTVKKGDVVYTIKGSLSFNGQNHFYYESQSCVVHPQDNNSLNIVFSTQYMNGLQEGLSQLLNISANRINIKVLRCGGAFGGKVTRAMFTASGCALAAYLLQQPVRSVTALETNMRSNTGRYLMYSKYEAGVDNEGVIQYLKLQYYCDKGVSINESLTSVVTKAAFPNVYDSSTWTVDLYDVRTDKPIAVPMRAPGTLQAVGCVEHIMEHIAWTVKKDPMTVRLNNLAAGSPIPRYLTELNDKSDYHARLANCREFNISNKWKKRGISTVPLNFNLLFQGVLHGLVSVYRVDGTVAISHGGMELGQGINTKVAQVAAHVLGIPVHIIQVKAANNLTSPNDIATVSSAATDSVCLAVKRCCEELNERLKPVRDSLSTDVTWPVVIKTAYTLNINLNTTYMFDPTRDLNMYKIYGLTVLEVEVDCLTGEHRIIRVDIMQNTGESLNPYIDIGQIEGSFLMGLGHFTCEHLIFDPDTGLLTTDRTWEYKIPGAKDIPEDWRIYFSKDPDSPSATGVYGSKSISEAPLVMSVSVVFAIRRALESLRRDLGLPDIFFNNDPPCTAENIFLRSQATYEDYTL